MRFANIAIGDGQVLDRNAGIDDIQQALVAIARQRKSLPFDIHRSAYLQRRAVMPHIRIKDDGIDIHIRAAAGDAATECPVLRGYFDGIAQDAISAQPDDNGTIGFDRADIAACRQPSAAKLVFLAAMRRAASIDSRAFPQQWIMHGRTRRLSKQRIAT